MEGDQVTAFAIQHHLIFWTVAVGLAVFDHQNDQSHLKNCLHFVDLLSVYSVNFTVGLLLDLLLICD